MFMWKVCSYFILIHSWCSIFEIRPLLTSVSRMSWVLLRKHWRTHKQRKPASPPETVGGKWGEVQEGVVWWDQEAKKSSQTGRRLWRRSSLKKTKPSRRQSEETGCFRVLGGQSWRVGWKRERTRGVDPEHGEDGCRAFVMFVFPTSVKRLTI